MSDAAASKTEPWVVVDPRLKREWVLPQALQYYVVEGEALFDTQNMTTSSTDTFSAAGTFAGPYHRLSERGQYPRQQHHAARVRHRSPFTHTRSCRDEKGGRYSRTLRFLFLW